MHFQFFGFFFFGGGSMNPIPGYNLPWTGQSTTKLTVCFVYISPWKYKLLLVLVHCNKSLSFQGNWTQPLVMFQIGNTTIDQTAKYLKTFITLYLQKEITASIWQCDNLFVGAKIELGQGVRNGRCLFGAVLLVQILQVWHIYFALDPPNHLDIHNCRLAFKCYNIIWES